MEARAAVDEVQAVLTAMQEFAAKLAREPLDELTRLEGCQWLFEYTAAMVEYYTHADPARPIVMPMVTPFRRFLGDLRLAKHCYVAKLSPDYSYELRCAPGDAVFTSITVHADEDGGMAGNRTLGKLNHDEIRQRDDGTFTVVIGADPRGDNTITIDETAGSLMTREFFYEPLETRREARWQIEVTGGPARPPAPNPVDLTAALRAARTNLAQAFARHPRPADAAVFGHAPANGFEEMFAFSPDNVTTWGNLDAIHTTMAWSLEPDEALVIDGGPIVDAAWWGITLSNRYLASFGRGEPTALAGNAITPDANGRWQLVLSPVAPRAGNWLTTLGRRNGVLRIRWLCARERPAKPTTRVVGLEELE